MHAVAGLITALATVVPQQGMLGVKLGASVSQVQQRLGRPDAFAFRPDPIIGRVRVWRYGRTRLTFDGDGRSARVISFTTTSRSQRLRNGVGVGSTRARVLAGVRGVRCRVESGLDHCWVGTFAPGRIVTDFPLRGGRVGSITVGRVID
jgi:hypothetical protein